MNGGSRDDPRLGLFSLAATPVFASFFLWGFGTGALVDRTGRQPMLVVGLVLLALALFLFVGLEGLVMGFGIALAFGVGKTVATNTNQTLAMDLVPVETRGYFVGTWQATTNAGS